MDGSSPAAEVITGANSCFPKPGQGLCDLPRTETARIYISERAITPLLLLMVITERKNLQLMWKKIIRCFIIKLYAIIAFGGAVYGN